MPGFKQALVVVFLSLCGLCAAQAGELVLVSPTQKFDVSLDGVPQGKQAGPFGSGGDCPVQAYARSSWPATQEIELQRDFFVPAGVTRVDIHLALDNDAYVLLNGNDVGIGLTRRDGCPPPEGNVVIDGFSFVPGTKNRLVVYGMNRGLESFLGVRVIGHTGD